MKYKFTTREIYKILKKYDRQEMEEFLERLYLNGYRDGQETIQEAGISEEKLSKVLDKTKGVGIKTYDAIMREWEKWNNERV